MNTDKTKLANVVGGTVLIAASLLILVAYWGAVVYFFGWTAAALLGALGFISRKLSTLAARGALLLVRPYAD